MVGAVAIAGLVPVWRSSSGSRTSQAADRVREGHAGDRFDDRVDDDPVGEDVVELRARLEREVGAGEPAHGLGGRQLERYQRWIGIGGRAVLFGQSAAVGYQAPQADTRVGVGTIVRRKSGNIFQSVARHASVPDIV